MRKAKQDRDEEEARYDEETRAALQVALSANKTTRAGKVKELHVTNGSNDR